MNMKIAYKNYLRQIKNEPIHTKFTINPQNSTFQANDFISDSPTFFILREGIAKRFPVCHRHEKNSCVQPWGWCRTELNQIFLHEC